MIFFSPHYDNVTSVSIYNFPGIPLMSKVSDKIHMGSQASICFSTFSIIDSEALGPWVPRTYIISHNCCTSPAASFITQTGGLRWVGVQNGPCGILNCVCLEFQIDACHHCFANTFKENNKSPRSLFYFPIHLNITNGKELFNKYTPDRSEKAHRSDSQDSAIADIIPLWLILARKWSLTSCMIAPTFTEAEYHSHDGVPWP